MVECVPDQVFRPQQILQDGTTNQSTFEQCFPELEIVRIPGDGSSCQFEAVAESACGTHAVSGILRERAVGELRKNWSDVGSFVLAEVAHQAQVPESSLDLDKCCEFLLGSAWGNHCTLVQLPKIVGKSIVVLTISQGKPFKHIFNCEGSNNTIHIGFLPEFHYFPLVAKPTPVALKKGDKGLVFISQMTSQILP